MTILRAPGSWDGTDLTAAINTSGVYGTAFSAPSGVPIHLTLTGTWTGTVRLLRSSDGGATKLPLTAAGSPWASFSSNCCEAVWEDATGADLYVETVGLTGTVNVKLER